ncbi:MAG: methyltransferase domain-containing protein [Nitrolancea sp.]
MADQTAAPSAFDRVAPRYDREFTDQQLGALLRGAVWREMEAAFHPGDSVLDLGCGTGEDACHLAHAGVNVLGLDASAAMLEMAVAKARRAEFTDRVRFAQLDLREVDAGYDLLHFTGGNQIDGAYSNFGPLNCLPDRVPLASALARAIRPGGTFIAVVMGPTCPWEFSWFLLHGHPRTATRRYRRGFRSVVGGQELRVWYPSPRTLRREFEPAFDHVKTVGVGVFLPPSDLGRLVTRVPRLFSQLNAVDDRARNHFPWTWLNDHYLSVFRRRDEG